MDEGGTPPRDGQGLHDMDLFDTTQTALERAMIGTSARQAALADNLANANTPGYQRKDVELLLRIRHLLYDERFTIEGARARLRELGEEEKATSPPLPEPEIDRELARKIKQAKRNLVYALDQIRTQRESAA